MSAWENSRHFATLYHWFPARNVVWETTAEMLHYPDLGIDSDWSKREGNLLQPIRSTTQICHQYGISAIVCQMSSRGNPDGEVPKWRLFVQTRAVHVIYLLSLKIFHLQFFAWLRNYFSFYVFFFVMDRKQLKIAVCRIDSAMQRRGSLNQQPLRFVVDTLKLDVR